MKHIFKLALALILAPTFALAAPTGGAVTGGSSGVVNSPNLGTINQNTVHLPNFNTGGTITVISYPTIPTNPVINNTSIPTPTIPISSIRGNSPTPVFGRETSIDTTRLGLNNTAQKINYMKAQTSVNLSNLETAAGNSDPAQSINLIGIDDSLSIK
jgi:hypothetical protein